MSWGASAPQTLLWGAAASQTPAVRLRPPDPPRRLRTNLAKYFNCIGLKVQLRVRGVWQGRACRGLLPMFPNCFPPSCFRFRRKHFGSSSESVRTHLVTVLGRPGPVTRPLNQYFEVSELFGLVCVGSRRFPGGPREALRSAIGPPQLPWAVWFALQVSGRAPGNPTDGHRASAAPKAWTKHPINLYLFD